MKIPAILEKSLKSALKSQTSLSFVSILLKNYPKAEVFLVGGIIRDWLLKRPSKDFDFVVRGVPAKKLEAFLKKHGIVNLVGERFGVFKFIPKKLEKNPLARALDGKKTIFDIALPRTEHALGTGGYRDVETQSDYQLPIEKDLSRRDFTINAMALKLKSFDEQVQIIKNKKRLTNKKRLIVSADFVDPFDGLTDLKKKIIRAVGNPIERFQEDYSRILRALRFASQLNFTIEDKTWAALKNKIKNINAKIKITGEEKRLVPYEVISREFLKSIMSNPIKTIDIWDEAGAFKQIMPELLKMKNCPQHPEFHAEGDVWTHTRLAVAVLGSAGFKKFVKNFPKNLQQEPVLTPELTVGVLFHDIGKPYTIKTPEKDGVDRIRNDEHDSVGADLIRKIGSRLKFSSVAEYPCDIEKIAWLIQHHLLTAHGDPLKFTNRTIEKYFFNSQLPGGCLLKLIYCDQMASLVNGKPQLGSLPSLVKRIKNLLKNLKQKKSLPPSLLNGDEIMKILKIKPGKQVGEVIEKMREEQLSGRIKNKKQAKKFILIARNLPFYKVEEIL